MKVVLFCGGFGMRLRGFSESVPKPLVEIGDQPILLHIMQYYASFGHTDFILCLGWKSDAIRLFFTGIEEIEDGGFDQPIRDCHQCEFKGWNVSFVNTGLDASIGERLKQLESLLMDEPYFYANYADGLCDVDLDSLTKLHLDSDSLATFISVNPTQSFHTVSANAYGDVTSIASIANQNMWMNGGYFIFSGDFFEYLEDGDELVEAPFQRLIERGRLKTHQHRGFWSCMDTYKEMQMLEEMNRQGQTPWKVWQPEFPTNFAMPQPSTPTSPAKTN